MAQYHYKEENKIDGKTTRTGGVTKRSLAAMKHLPKVGVIKSVKGYTYNGRYNTTHTGVLVKGDKGSIRFGGFSWGYNGEGCRGLQTLFDTLNVPAKATTIAEWADSDQVGEHWKITI